MDTKSLYDDVYRPDGFDYGAARAAVDIATSAQALQLKTLFHRFQIGPEKTVLEVGCGLGHLHCLHPSWHGIEYSHGAIEIARERYPGIRIEEGDARSLPTQSNSVDFLFSFAALEHVPEVEKAFAEVERVLKPGGLAVIWPAWNCRPWTVKKLKERPYAELGLSERIGKFLIPLRELLLFRLLCAVPGRVAREFRLAVSRDPIELQYKTLQPDFSLWARYGHTSDDDAFISLDAHAAISYFVSRGWPVPSHRTVIRRLSSRHEPVVAQKPG